MLRDILFEFEAQEDWRVKFPETFDMRKEERNTLGHIRLLCDAGLATEESSGAYRLTNSGHDYLEAIRADTVWEKTKAGAAQVGGMTLGMMKDLAIACVKQEAAEKLGIDL